jgi:tetratricopeptide (TPR) repeat protein
MPQRQQDDARRWFEQGLLRERSGDGASAVAAYRRALTIDGSMREARNALAFFYQRQGLFAKAAEEFRAIARLSDDYFAHYNLGYVLIEMERFDEAEREFRRCLELVADDAASYLELAYILVARGEYAAALEALALPMSRYEDDWEVHTLVGRCRIGLRDFPGAGTALQQAWRLATDIIAQGEILAQLGMLERYREFRHFESIKDEVYAVDGVVYLGSAGDDGLVMRELPAHHFSYADIALTVQRLTAFLSSSRATVAAVQALDQVSLPLARAISRALAVPLLDTQSEAATQPVLQVLAIGRAPELLSLARERADGPVISFCLAVNWLKHSRQLPDVSGVIVHEACSVPWEAELRGAVGAALEEAVEIATARLLDTLRGQIPEANLSRQMRYYTRSHRRLTRAAVGMPINRPTASIEA